MKILQLFNQYRFRGGEEMWVDGIPSLLNGIAAVDELRFSSNDWTGANAPSLLKQIRLMGDNPASRKALREHVERFKPDVLLFHNIIPVGSFGLYQEAKSLGIPVLQYTHNFRPFSPSGTLWLGDRVNDAALRGNPWPEILAGAWQGSLIKTAILALHLKLALRNGLLECVDHWLAISNFMRDKFIEAGIPPEKITVLRHCWDTGPEPESTAEGSHYLFLGRLVREKGTHNLVDAWKLLEKTLGDRCPRLIIAGNGPDEKSLKKRASGHPAIAFVGYIDGSQKQQLLQTCRALLVPSIWWEPLGLTAFEAFNCQRPVIATRSGALQEIVMDGVTGWLHAPDDAADIARLIMAAEQSGPDERAKRGTNGRVWLQRNASRDRWRDVLLQVIEKAISKKLR